MDFCDIVLKPLSLQILSYLAEHADDPPQTSVEIGEALGIEKRRVDAAITKSLVRWSFVYREAKLTELRKKMYNVIVITPRGKSYIKWREGLQDEKLKQNIGDLQPV